MPVLDLGNFTSANLKVTERHTRIAPDHLMHEATIEDPETFTKPWKISMPLHRRIERDAQGALISWPVTSTRTGERRLRTALQREQGGF